MIQSVRIVDGDRLSDEIRESVSEAATDFRKAVERDDAFFFDKNRDPMEEVMLADASFAIWKASPFPYGAGVMLLRGEPRSAESWRFIPFKNFKEAKAFLDVLEKNPISKEEESRIRTEHEAKALRVTAVHEAAHAVVARVLGEAAPLAEKI